MVRNHRSFLHLVEWIDKFLKGFLSTWYMLRPILCMTSACFLWIQSHFIYMIFLRQKSLNYEPTTGDFAWHSICSGNPPTEQMEYANCQSAGNSGHDHKMPIVPALERADRTTIYQKLWLKQHFKNNWKFTKQKNYISNNKK